MATLAALAAAVFAVLTAIATPAKSQAPPPVERPPEFQGHGSEARNLRLVGHNDLQGRSAYQPLTKRNPINGHWYTYVGHHAGSALNPLTNRVEPNGTTIVRVTAPDRPRIVTHIPATGNQNQAQMVRVCNGRELPDGDEDKVYLLRANGNVSHEIWDVTRPRDPELVVTVVDGLQGTHKNYWDCRSGRGYIVGGRPGWGTERMTMLFDLSDPENPVHIRDWGLPGQQPGGNDPQSRYEVHGGIEARGHFYNGYGTSANGVYEILNVQNLWTAGTAPTNESLSDPDVVVSRRFLPRYYGAHTTFPVLGIPVKDDEDFFFDTRDILVVSNESTSNECQEAHQQAFFVDVTDKSNPLGISNYKVDEDEGDFCERGGRFGNHSSNENMTDEYYGKIVFFAYFNAGIRAVDIRDPFQPREVGKYIPATTDNTAERCIDTNGDAPGGQRCKIAIQTNNLDTDNREYVYAVDRANTGLHIVTVTGAARRIMEEEIEPNEPDASPPLDEVGGE